ncbi:MAG: hypothetical protein LBT38_08310 [Deltaproteobacteria bacterium]|jgi:nickel transport protein|nr:hypothetical protein [Deltaproteobacteria bacterium]
MTNRSVNTVPAAWLKNCWLKTLCWALAVSFLAGLLASDQVMAHAVYIFAWPDGERICSDSYFSRSNKVQGGLVRIKDSAGQILAEGLSDDNGGVCFPRPRVEGDLFFEVEAGEGHRAEFTLRAADLSPLPETSAASPASSPETPASTSAPSGSVSSTGSLSSSGSIDSGALASEATLESLRVLVREELKTQLSPINRALAESRKTAEPGYREIIGGLGWLVGVFGLTTWLMGRRKAQK